MSGYCPDCGNTLCLCKEIKVQESRDFVWVPEDHVFDSAPECLGRFPDAGPACMFPAPTAYETLLEENAALKAEVERLRVALGQAQLAGIAYFDSENERLKLTTESYRAIIAKFLEHSRECADDYNYIYGDTIKEARKALETE